MTRAPLLALAVAALFTSSCGAALMRLPQGPGVAAADGRDAFDEATLGCHALTSFSAQVSVSGSVDGQRIRATLQVGLEGNAARLDALAYSQAIFVFVSHDRTATLLLQREQRVVQDGDADRVLEAVTGVPLRSDTLKSTLTGCTVLAAFRDAERLEENWRTVPDADGLVYLQRSDLRAPWMVAAATHTDASGAEWVAEFRKPTKGLPRDIRLRSLGTGRGKPFDLHLVVSQVEVNVPLDSRAFSVQVPASAVPMTIDELRKAGPLGASSELRMGAEVFADGR